MDCFIVWLVNRLKYKIILIRLQSDDNFSAFITIKMIASFRQNHYRHKILLWTNSFYWTTICDKEFNMISVSSVSATTTKTSGIFQSHTCDSRHSLSLDIHFFQKGHIVQFVCMYLKCVIALFLAAEESKGVVEEGGSIYNSTGQQQHDWTTWRIQVKLMKTCQERTCLGRISSQKINKYN